MQHLEYSAREQTRSFYPVGSSSDSLNGRLRKALELLDRAQKAIPVEGYGYGELIETIQDFLVEESF